MKAPPALVVLVLALALVAIPVRADTQLQLYAEGLPRVGKALPLDAVLRDASGKPIAGAKVTFFEKTAFGRLTLGTSTTNGLGKAYWTFSPAAQGTFLLGVSFAGNATYGPVETTLGVKVPTTNPGGLELPPYVIILGAIGTVVLAIWATYVFVVLQILLIYREGRAVGQSPAGPGTGGGPGEGVVAKEKAR